MTTEMSAAEFQRRFGNGETKPSKYGNKRIVIDGVHWDSQAEYTRWWQLQQLEREGTITELRRQVRIPLSVDGDYLGAYVADFSYLQDGVKVLEDVKSPISRTPIYEWKKKHVLAQYGIAITEIDS